MTYIRKIKRKNKDELKVELQGLEAYFDGCQRGEVSDLVVNIDFCYAKVCALRQLLDITSKYDLSIITFWASLVNFMRNCAGGA